MKWHKLDTQGRIVRTVDALDRQTATALLGGGSVVSDVSLRLDVHKFKPIETVVTDTVQTQERKEAVYRYKKGWRRLREIAVLLSARENQIRHIVDKFRIPSETSIQGGRKIRFFHPSAVKQIEKRLNNIPERIMARSVVETRRQGVIEFYRQRYAQGIHGRTQRRIDV